MDHSMFFLERMQRALAPPERTQSNVALRPVGQDLVQRRTEHDVQHQDGRETGTLDLPTQAVDGVGEAEPVQQRRADELGLEGTSFTACRKATSPSIGVQRRSAGPSARLI